MSDLSALVEALRPRRKALGALWEAVTTTCSACEGKGTVNRIKRDAEGNKVYSETPVQYGRSKKDVWYPPVYEPVTCEWDDLDADGCNGTGRMPRDVGEWPVGAVWGSLDEACRKVGWKLTWSQGNRTWSCAVIQAGVRPFVEPGHLGLSGYRADRDAAALAAVLEAVRAVPEDGEEDDGLRES